MEAETQRVLFIDPKGIRNHQPIVSNTKAAVMEQEWTPMKKAEMQARNILFQADDRESYVGAMLATVGLT